jgi:hypothetical protein
LYFGVTGDFEVGALGGLVEELLNAVPVAGECAAVEVLFEGGYLLWGEGGLLGDGGGVVAVGGDYEVEEEEQVGWGHVGWEVGVGYIKWGLTLSNGV